MVELHSPSWTAVGAWSNEDVLEALRRVAPTDQAHSQAVASPEKNDAIGPLADLIGERLHGLFEQREAQQRALETAVVHFSEVLLGLAAGDFSQRARRTFEGDPIDVLAYLINNTAHAVGRSFVEREQEAQKTEAILEGMNDGVLLLDPDGAVLRVNQALASLLGHAPAALNGTAIEALLADEPSPRSRLLSPAGLSGERPLQAVRFRTLTGESVELTVQVSTLRADTEEPGGYVLLARDERELRRTQARLQLADRLAAVGRTAAGVVHEINNPLASVIANLEFLRDQVKVMAKRPVREEELIEAIDDALEGVGRVRSIVRDLRSFARPENEPGTLVNVNELLEAAANLLGTELRQCERLVHELGEVPPVDAHGSRVVQIFVNLLQNAVQSLPQAGGEPSAIHLRTYTDATGSAVIEVQDNGRGICERDLTNVFEPFFTTRPQGLGMGLSIAHNLVTTMGGSLVLESQVGVGTMARVVLPPAKAGRDEITGASPAISPPLPWSPTRPSRTS